MFENKPASPALALLRREALSLGRSGNIFMVLVGLIGLVMLTGAAVLPFVYLRGGSTGYFATMMFRMQFRYLYFAALFIVPVVASSSMVSEYKNECFPMLYTTLVRPGWILWGKAISVVGLFGMLYVGCMPVAGLAYFYAGFETVSLFQAAVVLFSLALATSSIGLLLATGSSNHYRAMYRTGSGVIALMILPSLAGGLGRVFAAPSWVESLLNHLVESSAYDTVLSGIPDWRPVLACAAYYGVVAGCCLLLAWWRVQPRRSAVGLRVVRRFAPVLGLLAGRRRRRPIADGQNPIAIRDVRMNPLSHGLLQIGLALAGLLIGLLLTLALAQSGSQVEPLIALMMLGAVRYPFFLVLPPMVAMAVASERENGTLDGLRTSLLSPRDVLRGKVIGIWRIVGPFVGLVVVGQLIGITAWVFINPAADVLLRLLLAIFGALALVLTVHAIIIFSLVGAQSKRTIAGAILVSYLSVFGLWIGVHFISTLGASALMTPMFITGGVLPNQLAFSGAFYVVLLGFVLMMRRSAVQGMQRLMGAQ